MEKMENLKRKLEEFQRKLSNLESNIAQKKAELKIYKKQMQEEFGVDTLEELNHEIEDMKLEREELEVELIKKVDYLEKELEKLK